MSRPIIGIAGGIGSGKSAVAKQLGDLGCVVSDSDRDGRAALEDPEIKRTLVSWWGEGILAADGTTDRRAIARIVFADAEERRRLEGLTHPWIEERRKALFAAAAADVPALVIDAPLLFEAGLDATCDAVIFVDAPREQRLARVAAGRGWDEAEVRRREDSQLALDVKRSGADYVVWNDGDLSELEAQVRTILNKILQHSP
ncbi:MAG: dephospho-CoA kinase [Phycisphaerales bacterium]|nr:dephospho-CoA kinase [Phycisphaerae bacterium]NNF42305.1 dephospho-CoA kinase [Phycisphaerales bacterium]NNM26204.1 dephospho-CoA kinase [Phycisphaerales bacterium]